MEGNRFKIVGIGGSLAEHSTSLESLKIALKGAEEAGAEVELCSIRDMNLPMFDPKITTPPDSVQRFLNTSHLAHGMLWSSPLYNGTVSGSFKNAMDWYHLLGNEEPPFLADKIIGLISTAGGVQGLQAVNSMEFIVRSLRAWAVPWVIPISKAKSIFDENGCIQDPAVESQLKALGAEVLRAARQFSDEGACDYSRPYSIGKA